MYAVYVDNKLLYSTAPGENQIIINPKISLERNKPGLFSFTLPPGNLLYDSIEKLSSTITVEQDGEEIYRGRITDDEMDFAGQKNVECECELAYFHDSIQRPYEFDGTPMGLFRLLIDNHNEMVNEDQRFTIGIVTAISDSGKAQVDTDEYNDTFSELNSRMINVYGGLLRIRHAGGVRYIDYLADGEANSQIIEFGVNLLDLKKNISTDEVFNVLIPKGASLKGDNGRYTEALKINDVNGGLDYIEDEAAIARCKKRIWKTKQWNYIEDAQELLEKGREYLATGISEETTLTINAVDMHFVDASQQRIGIGDRVRILSNPHGIDRTEICTKIQMDMLNPENTQYTFGKQRMTLTDNMILAKKQYGGGGGKTLKEEVSDLKRYARIYTNEFYAYMDLIAGEYNTLTNDFKEVGIVLDGIEADLNLYAEKFDSAENALTKIEIDLNAMDEALTLLVEKDGIATTINASPGEVLIKAGKIDLQGYVTASELAALSAEIGNLVAGYTTAKWIRAENLDASIMADLKAMRLDGEAVSKQNVTMGSITSAGQALTTGGVLDLSHSHKIIVGTDGKLQLGEVAAEGGFFNIADTQFFKDAVSAAFEEGKAEGGVPNLSDARGPVPTQAGGLNELAKNLGTTSGNMIRCFSAVNVGNSGYYGFKVTAGSTTKYYYFVIT